MKLYLSKTPLPTQIQRNWHLIDAKDKSLGRVATEAAKFLIGKHKENFTPHLDIGDYVIIINAKKIKITGNKLKNKIYHRYTGYLGNLKNITLEERWQKNPKKVIEDAVKGMIPTNRLKASRLKRLKIFLDENHPYHDKISKS